MDSPVVAWSGHVRFSGNIPGICPGSQVQIILIGHGPASTNTLSRARQLLTPQDPGLGSALGAPIAGPAGVGKGISVFTAPQARCSGSVAIAVSICEHRRSVELLRNNAKSDRKNAEKTGAGEMPCKLFSENDRGFTGVVVIV